jgi:hypothetical protein
VGVGQPAAHALPHGLPVEIATWPASPTPKRTSTAHQTQARTAWVGGRRLRWDEVCPPPRSQGFPTPRGPPARCACHTKYSPFPPSHHPSPPLGPIVSHCTHLTGQASFLHSIDCRPACIGKAPTIGCRTSASWARVPKRSGALFWSPPATAPAPGDGRTRGARTHPAPLHSKRRARSTARSVSGATAAQPHSAQPHSAARAAQHSAAQHSAARRHIGSPTARPAPWWRRHPAASPWPPARG